MWMNVIGCFLAGCWWGEELKKIKTYLSKPWVFKEGIGDQKCSICRTCVKTAAKSSGKTMIPPFHGLIESIRDLNKYPRRKVEVKDGNSNSKFYIVGHPVSVLKALTSWASCGFVAMSVDTKQLVFLKDSCCQGHSGLWLQPSVSIWFGCPTLGHQQRCVDSYTITTQTTRIGDLKR